MIGKWGSRMAVAIIAAALAGCSATVQPYGQKGFYNVGYSEKQVDDITFEVSYDGNAAVSRESAWNFWIYRCAQLTLEKKHNYFTMVQRPGVGQTAPVGGMRFAGLNKEDGWRMLATKGGGGVHTSYVYLPGGSFTTWHSKALIQMFDDTPPEGVIYALDAQSIVRMLGGFVQSQGHVAGPARDTVLQSSQVRVNLSPLRGI